MCFGTLIDDFKDIVGAFGDNADLIEGSARDLGLDQISQSSERDHPAFQRTLGNGFPLVNQQIAPFRFVLVLGKLRATEELFWMLPPLGDGFKEGLQAS